MYAACNFTGARKEKGENKINSELSGSYVRERREKKGKKTHQGRGGTRRRKAGKRYDRRR